jgi:hypothetical protein
MIFDIEIPFDDAQYLDEYIETSSRKFGQITVRAPNSEPCGEAATEGIPPSAHILHTLVGSLLARSAG